MVQKIRRKNKSDYGKDFVAPDGGWAWVVCIASAITNIFMFPVFQAFGLIFRDKFIENGISNQQIAIIINSQIGFASLTGFFYGPIFKRFTFRKISIFGSILLISGIYFLSLAEDFTHFFLIYVFYLAVGKELIIAAKQMAFNTYFDLKRRKAMSIVSSLAQIGNIITPFLITFLTDIYSNSDTLLILSALAGNVFIASLTYQPVKWHVKKKIISTETVELNENSRECNILDSNKEESYENSSKSINCKNIIIESNQQTECDIITLNKNEDNNLIPKKNINDDQQAANLTQKCHVSYSERIVSFFDMDLLKDFSFLNICFGLACVMLVEQNFTILAPFFLKDFGYTNIQIALAMSIERIVDLITNILIPHVLDLFKVKWKNRTLWVLCVGGMIAAEIVIAFNFSYATILCFLIFEGIFCGAKAIFTGMLIRDHIALYKMPAALGINRFMNGLLFISMGPIIGSVRESSNYTVVLLFLAILSILPISLWLIEMHFKNKKKSKNNEEAH